MFLVTGATGYLGAVLTALLHERGYEVRAVVRDRGRADVLPDGVVAVEADLDDRESLTRAARGCDGLFHLAASVGHSPQETTRLNVAGTRRVLRAVADADVPRLVYTSSSAAIIDESGLVSEQAENRTALTDAYSTSKAEAEGLVLEAARDGLSAMIVNPTSVYGPSPRGPESYNALFAAAAAGTVTEIVDARIGWVFAADAALGHLLAMEKGSGGRRYVLSGEQAGFGWVLNRYAELVGSPHRVRPLPPGKSLPPEASVHAHRSEVYGKLPPVRVDDAQARALGFAPRGVEEGLQATAAWIADR